jgi:hypothetical protein
VGTPCVRLIFCADGNSAHARAAIAAGWEYGVRLPARGMLSGVPLAFADQDWRRPDRQRYMACLAKHRPALATVLDWEEPEQFAEVLSWAEEAAQYAREAVLIVPKLSGQINHIPRRPGGKDVWLAYSIPTAHGAAPIMLYELAGWPVHLLGGSPQRQMEAHSYLRGIADVRSADGNMARKMATSRCLYWTAQKSRYGHWQPLGGFEGNGPLEALSRSLSNIRNRWTALRLAQARLEGP